MSDGGRMSRRRRAALLGGLALLLGGLAASDVAGREAALRRDLGPTVGVVVAREALAAGTRLDARRLAVRRVPARYAPRGAFAETSGLTGLRVRAAVAAGADLTVAALDAGRRSGAGAPVRPGERVADVVAVAPALAPSTRVDVLVTRGRRTTLALEDVEVLAARSATATDGRARVEASLRVTLRQAVYLAAAQAFARELRLLPRAAGDRRRSVSEMTVGDGL
jgi:pilus assembly protein CpaB